jgi:hypothetical protein
VRFIVRAMFKPPPRWAWLRYLVWSLALALLLFEFGSRHLPQRHLTAATPTTRPRPATVGRVTIPNIPHDSDARFDDEIIREVAAVPSDSRARGCWRLRNAGNDAGTMDRVDCRLPGDTVHLFEVRHTSGEPELWRITIPSDGEAILMH